MQNKKQLSLVDLLNEQTRILSNEVDNQLNAEKTAHDNAAYLRGKVAGYTELLDFLAENKNEYDFLFESLQQTEKTKSSTEASDTNTK